MTALVQRAARRTQRLALRAALQQVPWYFAASYLIAWLVAPWIGIFMFIWALIILRIEYSEFNSYARNYFAMRIWGVE